MRLDKYLSNLGYGSRKEVSKFIKSHDVFINDILITKKDPHISFGDKISFGDEEIFYRENIYILLHKPKNYISSSKSEGGYKSYQDLLLDCVYLNIIHIVGRLDADTTGFLLLTNNGDFTHSIISPKKEIFKTYIVEILSPLSEIDRKKLQSGVQIDNYFTKPAKVEIISSHKIKLSISEGRFHQVKKMLEAVGNKVISLHRESIGGLELGDLALGEWKYLSEDEVNKIFDNEKKEIFL